MFPGELSWPELSVHLEVGGGGAVLPTAQRLHGDRAAERARLLPVKPQAQALVTKHVLGTQPLSRPAGPGLTPTGVGNEPRGCQSSVSVTFQRSTTPGLRGFPLPHFHPHFPELFKSLLSSSDPFLPPAPCICFILQSQLPLFHKCLFHPLPPLISALSPPRILSSKHHPVPGWESRKRARREQEELGEAESSSAHVESAEMSLLKSQLCQADPKAASRGLPAQKHLHRCSQQG